MSTGYAPHIQDYIHTTPSLDEKVFSLWESWNHGNPHKEESLAIFHEAVSEARQRGNIGETYAAHCQLVADMCEISGGKIAENYPEFFERGANIDQFFYAGLTEDSMYLVLGDGSNNPNGENGGEIHEILTYQQMKHLGYDKLAEGMALHFVSPIMLQQLHNNNKFLDVHYRKNVMLDVLTAVDALCTTEWLPDLYGGDYECALAYRIEDIRKRRGPNHLLTMALDSGGQEHLLRSVRTLQNLENGSYLAKS